MKSIMKILTVLIVVQFVFSCQKSSEDITGPVSQSDLSLEKHSEYPISSDLTLYEPDFKEYLLADNLSNPEGVVVHDKSKGILVGQSVLGNIISVDHEGVHSEFASIPHDNPPYTALIDLLYDKKMGVFVTSLRHGKIVRIDESGNQTDYATGLNYPLFMESDHKRNLYVSELFGDCITRIDPLQNKTKIIINNEIDPWIPRGIVFGKKDKLYVLAASPRKETWMYNNKKNSVFPMNFSDGELIATLSDSNNPQDITIGDKGDLFVVGESNIWRVKLDGTVSKFADGLVGVFNTINSTKHGDLMVTDYAGGKVLGISKKKFSLK